MKIIAFILILIQTFTYVKMFGQNKEEIIKGIRKDYKAINNDKTLEKVVLSNEEFLEQPTDGGGQLTGFYKSGQLKKMVIWVGLSSGKRIFEYYFKNDTLIFIYEEFNSFIYDSISQRFRLDATEKTFDSRYYFYHNKLINQMTTGHNRFEDDTINAQETLLKETYDNRKLLEQKKNKEEYLEINRGDIKARRKTQ